MYAKVYRFICKCLIKFYEHLYIFIRSFIRLYKKYFHPGSRRREARSGPTASLEYSHFTRESRRIRETESYSSELGLRVALAAWPMEGDARGSQCPARSASTKALKTGPFAARPGQDPDLPGHAATPPRRATARRTPFSGRAQGQVRDAPRACETRRVTGEASCEGRGASCIWRASPGSVDLTVTQPPPLSSPRRTAPSTSRWRQTA